MGGLLSDIANGPLNLQRSIDEHALAMQQLATQRAQLPGVESDSALKQTAAQQAALQLKDQSILSDAFRSVYGQAPSQFQQPASSAPAALPPEIQGLQSVKDQDTYDQWRAKNPGFQAPDKYFPDWTARQIEFAQRAASQSAQPEDQFQKMIDLAQKNGLSRTGLLNAQQQHMDYVKQGQALQAQHRELLDKNGAAAGSALEAFDNLPDEAKTLQRWQPVFDQIHAANLGTAEGLDRNTVPDEPTIRNAFGLFNYTKELTANQKTRADAAKAAADAGEASERTATMRRTSMAQDASMVQDQDTYAKFLTKYPELIRAGAPGAYSPDYVKSVVRSSVPAEKLPSYDLDQQFAQNNNQKSRHDAVDSIATDPAVRKLGYGLVDDARTPGEYEAVKKLIAEKQASLDQETNPAVLKARVNQAVATETAISPLKVKQQTETAKALRAGDNPALGGVAPADIPRVTAAAQKADQDYISAKSSAEDMAQILDMAGAGNKAAGANVSLAGVGAINAVNSIKRINSSEIHQYATAGSLYDKVVGKLQGWTEGKPIPQDVLDDMRSLHQALATESYAKYKQTLDALNARSGSKFGTVVPEPNMSVHGAQKQAVGGYRIGGSYQGKQYLGGDPTQSENWK